MRHADRAAIVTGRGQTLRETMGNGRATALRFAEEGARVLVVGRLAIQNGEYGIRVNVVLPGLMDTPMAIERRARGQDEP